MHENIGSGKRGLSGECPKLPEGDVLVHSGDLGERQSDIISFMQWFDKLDYKYKICIPGNHDRWIENQREAFMERYKACKHTKFLMDSSIEIEGKLFYGSPWTQNLPGWAFQLKEVHAPALWDMIPLETDVLITHAPPYGILDEVRYVRGREDAHVGDKALLERVKIVKPKLHVFGHIHEGRGTHTTLDTTFINASMLDENYYFWPSEAFTFDL